MVLLDVVDWRMCHFQYRTSLYYTIVLGMRHERAQRLILRVSADLTREKTQLRL